MATITVNSSYQPVSYSNWSKVISGTTYNFTLTTYAKLNGQNTDTKTSTIELKSVLTLKQPAYYVSVSSGTSVLNGTSKSFGSTTFNRGDTTLQTKTITITHNDDGTSPTQSVSASWTAAKTGNGSTSGSIKAPKMNLYPTIKTPYSFNATLESGNVVISNPRIDFNTDDSYASMNIYCAIFPANATEYESTTPYVSYRTLTSNEIRSGQFIFDDLSTSEKNGLAQASKYTNQLAVKYVLKTGTNKYSTMNANMNVSNVNPTFTTSYREQNGAVRTLLGEQPDTEITKVIKNASKVRLTVTASPKMYAEISNITLMHNNKDIQPISHSQNVYVFDVDVLSNTFKIMVIDSRGNGVNGTPPAYVDEQKTLINYTPININQAASIVRSTGLHKNNIVITFESPYTSTIDTYNNEYHVMYKLSSEQDYNDITELATVSGGKLFMTNVEIGNDDVIPYTESANVDLFISDKLGEDTETKTVLSAVSTFEAGKTDFQVNGDLFVADTNRQNIVNVLNTMMTENKVFDFKVLNITVDRDNPFPDIISNIGTLTKTTGFINYSYNSGEHVMIGYVYPTKNYGALICMSYNNNVFKIYTLNNGVYTSVPLISKARYIWQGYATSAQSSTTAVNVTNFSTTLTTYGGDIFVSVSAPFYQSGGTGNMRLYVDNVEKAVIIHSSSKDKVQIHGEAIVTGISAGSHTFRVTMQPQNNTFTCYIGTYVEKCFTIIEL